MNHLNSLHIMEYYKAIKNEKIFYILTWKDLSFNKRLEHIFIIAYILIKTLWNIIYQ